MRADWKLRIALDAVLAVPDLVAGLVLIAPAVTGAPPPDEESIELELLWLDQKIDEQIDLGDSDEANRYEVWLWLDGPRGPEGRVSGPARTLASEMNRIALTSNPVEA
jgi:pimeloyl-ACP methyl ester carboxylesterase